MIVPCLNGAQLFPECCVKDFSPCQFIINSCCLSKQLPPVTYVIEVAIIVLIKDDHVLLHDLACMPSNVIEVTGVWGKGDGLDGRGKSCARAAFPVIWMGHGLGMRRTKGLGWGTNLEILISRRGFKLYMYCIQVSYITMDTKFLSSDPFRCQ